jgi:hypothetical protein
VPEETSAPAIQRSSEGASIRPAPPDLVAGCVVGSPDAPAFKPQPILFVVALVLFAIWMAILIYWAVQLRVASR